MYCCPFSSQVKRWLGRNRKLTLELLREEGKAMLDSDADEPVGQVVPDTICQPTDSPPDGDKPES